MKTCEDCLVRTKKTSYCVLHERKVEPNRPACPDHEPEEKSDSSFIDVISDLIEGAEKVVIYHKDFLLLIKKR